MKAFFQALIPKTTSWSIWFRLNFGILKLDFRSMVIYYSVHSLCIIVHNFLEQGTKIVQSFYKSPFHFSSRHVTGHYINKLLTIRKVFMVEY
jgi:hypothetical protein